MEFSDQSVTTSSFVEDAEVEKREKTPSPDRAKVPELPQTSTPLGFNKDGVRGILRPTGTPGSGNGGASNSAEGLVS
jgi:hypothetical protein